MISDWQANPIQLSPIVITTQEPDSPGARAVLARGIVEVE